MSYDLPQSFLTDIAPLDSDHQALMAHINSMAELEGVGDKDRMRIALRHFMAILEEHFRREEDLFKRLNYPKLIDHANRHAETMVALDRLARDVESDESAASPITHTCLHTLLSSILTIDKEFTNWLAACLIVRKRQANSL